MSSPNSPHTVEGGHTPKLRVVADDLHFMSMTDIADEHGNLVAQMAGTDVNAMEANARVFAASFDMLEALKAIAFARPAGATPKLVKGELIERIENIALDAIRRTTGEN